jgi:hypothetical protein
MRGYLISCLTRSVPLPVREAIQLRADQFDITLPMTGFMTVNSSASIMAAHIHAQAGTSTVQVKTSRRNTNNYRDVSIDTLPVNLRNLIADHYNVHESSLAGLSLLSMIRGIKMNTRQVKIGSGCEFAIPHTNRTGVGVVAGIYYRLVEDEDEMVLFQISLYRSFDRPDSAGPCRVPHVAFRACRTLYIHSHGMRWHVVFAPSLDGNQDLRSVVRVAPMHMQ